MPSYDSTARVPFASGGRVGSKKPKIKRIILWKGKAKDWPGAKKAAERTKKAKGGSISDAPTDPKTGEISLTGKKLKMAIESGHVNKGRDKKTGRIIYTRSPLKKSGPFEGHKSTVVRDKKAKGGKAKDSVDQPGTHSWWLLNKNRRDKKAKGGKADKNWIQGVNKSIKKRGTKGVCTGKKFGSASCPPGSKRYNLAKTFKKMARAKHASGGLVRFI